MAKIKGIWVFNDEIEVYLVKTQSVNFSSNGVNYTVMELFHITIDPEPTGLKYGDTDVYFDTWEDAPHWVDDAYKTVDFGSTEQDISEDFYTWLTANAVMQEEEKPAVRFTKLNLSDIVRTIGNRNFRKLTTDVTPSLPVWNGTDLTGTTWYIPEGWSATSGYGLYTNTEGDCYRDGAVLSSLSGVYGWGIGYEFDPSGGLAPSANSIGLDWYDIKTTYTVSDFTLEFRGGTDMTNTSLISWLKQYGELTSHEMPSENLPVWNGLDLTGTTWRVPAGWEAKAYYASCAITGKIEYNQDWSDCNEAFNIGFSLSDSSRYVSTTNSIAWGESSMGYDSITNETEFTITFTGGSSVTNIALIAWLRQNGELTSHTLLEDGKVFTQGYTVTINSDTTNILEDSSNEVDIMLTLLDGSCVYVYSWDNYDSTTTWTDVVALTCTKYVSFTEGGLANYLENGIYYLSTDITIDKLLYLNCIDENTLVTMADGSAKRLGDVEVGDEVLSIDYDTMTLIARKVIYSGKDEPDYDNWFVNCYWENVFSDGTIIKQAMNHRFYNLENELYVYMKDWNTGEHTYKLDGTNPELVSRTLVQGRINYGRITLEDSNNYFANGLSTADRRACPNKVVLNAPLQRQ